MIVFTRSAVQALEIVAEARASLILILSDMNMRGLAASTLAKTRPVRPDVPVIIITTYCDAETRREAVKRGAADLFTKPIDFPELRVVIDRWIEAAMGPA